MKVVLALLFFFAFAGLCAAGPNEGGVLAVHHDPLLTFTHGWCDSLKIPNECGDLFPVAKANGEPQLWYVLAAFPQNAPERITTVAFGLGDYNDSTLVMEDWGPCRTFGGGEWQISTDNWPGPNSGTIVSWAPNCGSGDLVPVYWFITYAYGPAIIPLGEHPVIRAAFVECTGNIEDPIAAYGGIGFGQAGGNPCPNP